MFKSHTHRPQQQQLEYTGDKNEYLCTDKGNLQNINAMASNRLPQEIDDKIGRFFSSFTSTGGRLISESSDMTLLPISVKRQGINSRADPLPQEKDDKMERFFKSFSAPNEGFISDPRERASLIHGIKKHGDWILPPGDKQASNEMLRKKSTKSDGIAGLSITDLELAGIHLSKREIEKFKLLSRFQPGQIHNIPLNEYVPLPAIKKREEN